MEWLADGIQIAVRDLGVSNKCSLRVKLRVCASLGGPNYNIIRKSAHHFDAVRPIILGCWPLPTYSPDYTRSPLHLESPVFSPGTAPHTGAIAYRDDQSYYVPAVRRSWEYKCLRFKERLFQPLPGPTTTPIIKQRASTREPPTNNLNYKIYPSSAPPSGPTDGTTAPSFKVLGYMIVFTLPSSPLSGRLWSLLVRVTLPLGARYWCERFEISIYDSRVVVRRITILG